MMSKSVFAFAAVLALGSLSPATDASAAQHGGGGHGGGGGHFGGGHFSGHPGGGAHFSGGHFSPGHFGHGAGVRVAPGVPARGFAAGGHHRHFWHGRWWNYGVGPCWVWSDDYDEYVWACD
jgi:hypothetical protein